MITTPSTEDLQHMKHVEVALVNFLIPHREKMPPYQLAIVLMRCLRVIVRLSPSRADQDELVEQLIAYLQGQVKMPKSSVIWTPQ
jgi:hypothetical protein